MLEPPISVAAVHWNLISQILQNHAPAYEVWAFGSRARFQAKPFSDLDLAIISNQPLPLVLHTTLTNAFAESNLPFRVDLVDWATTNNAFRQIIAQDKVVIQIPQRGEDPHV